MNVQQTVPLVGDDKIDWTKIDTPLERAGKKIVIPGEPGEMPIPTAIDTLKRIEAAESQVYDVCELIDGMPWDAAVATFKAMQSIYGVILPETVRGWFRDFNPDFVTVKTGPAETDVIQIPMGQFRLPGMAAPLHIHLSALGCSLHAQVNKKDRARLIEIAMAARKIMREESIYRGKAISLKVDEDGDLDLSEQPEFFDVAEVRETDMIHNRMTESIIQTSILAPIKHTASCRKHGVSLKRGILLEGRYGCGKSLTARVTAKVAQDNGWTFIVIERAQGLEAAITLARKYEPCVVFAEDIDRFGDRTKEEVNDLVNCMDGLIPQSAALMVILTTNHVERIDKSLLRPGRLDAVISIDAPDSEAVQRLIRHYASHNLPADIDLTHVGEMLAGQIPASIAEVVKRSKLTMLTEDRETITEGDLVVAAESANRHLALLADIPSEKSAGDRLADDLTAIVKGPETVAALGRLASEVIKLRKELA